MIDSNINTNTSVRANNFLQNFFGINIFAEPNDFWNYEGRYDAKNERYIFVRNELKDNFDDSVYEIALAKVRRQVISTYRKAI